MTIIYDIQLPGQDRETVSRTWLARSRAGLAGRRWARQMLRRLGWSRTDWHLRRGQPSRERGSHQ